MLEDEVVEYVGPRRHPGGLGISSHRGHIRNYGREENLTKARARYARNVHPANLEYSKERLSARAALARR